MTVEIDEEEIAARVIGAELRIGEILWHVVAEGVSDEEVPDIADEAAHHATRIDETADGETAIPRLAALCRAIAERLDGGG